MVAKILILFRSPSSSWFR